MSAARFWRRPRIRRLTELTMTLAFWFVWFYLILPLISLLLWALGYHLFVDEMLARGGYVALLAELQNYGMVILAMLVITLSWIGWNRRHYGRHNKRTNQPLPLSPAEQAVQAGLTPGALSALQAARRATVRFDDQDRMQWKE